jgi:hypothetical protein
MTTAAQRREAREDDHTEVRQPKGTDMSDDNQKIIDAATVGCKLWKSEDGEAEKVGREFDAALGQLDEGDRGLVLLLVKLMVGCSQSFSSDNPASIEHMRDLALAIGATVEDRDDGHPLLAPDVVRRHALSSILMYPPSQPVVH